MQITITEANDRVALTSGGPEVWVRVLSNRQLGPQDETFVLSKLSDEGISLLDRCDSKMLAFYGDLRDNDEAEDEGYEHEAWFIYRRRTA